MRALTCRIATRTFELGLLDQHGLQHQTNRRGFGSLKKMIQRIECHITHRKMSNPTRRCDMKSNLVVVALDSHGNSRVVRTESPSGDMVHSLDLKTGTVETVSHMGTSRASVVTRYNVIELKCSGAIKTKFDCVPRCV